MTDIEDAIRTEVENATSAETFDALEFFSGASLPELDVKLYADSAAAFELAELLQKEKAQQKKAASEGIGITDEVEYIDEDRITELHERLLASEVVFHLRALSPAALSAIEKKLQATLPYKAGADNIEYSLEYNSTIVAKSIQSVRNAQGAKDKSEWTVQRVTQLAEALQPSELSKLWEAAFRVNFIGAAIDQAVSADFS